MTSPLDDRTGTPFTLTIVADFGAPSTASSDLLRLEAGEVPALFRKLRVWRELRTPDRLSGAPRRVAWAATFGSLRDFDPEPLLGRFPPAAPLLAWRARLLEVVRSGSGLPGLVDAVEELWPDVPAGGAGRAPASRGRSGAEALLDLVALPDAVGAGAGASADTPAGEDPEAAIGVRERLRLLLSMPETAPEVRLRLARETVEEALGRQLEAILHDPVLRDCEAAWRSLWAIGEAADLRRGDLRVHLLAAERGEAAEALARLLLWHEERPSGGPPGGAVLADYPIGGDAASSVLLAAAGRLARALEARVVLPLDPDLLGAGADRESGRPGAIADLLAAAPLAELARDEAHGVTLTCNRFLFRPPHDPEESPGPFGSWREPAIAAEGPYASAVWIAGRGLAAAVRRAGAEQAAALESVQVGGLPLRPAGRPGGADHLLATEFILDVAETRALIDAGLAPLTSDIDQDRVTLRRLRVYEGTVRDEATGRDGTGVTAAGGAEEATAGPGAAGAPALDAGSTPPPRTGITTSFTVATRPPRTDDEETAG